MVVMIQITIHYLHLIMTTPNCGCHDWNHYSLPTFNHDNPKLWLSWLKFLFIVCIESWQPQFVVVMIEITIHYMHLIMTTRNCGCQDWNFCSLSALNHGLLQGLTLRETPPPKKKIWGKQKKRKKNFDQNFFWPPYILKKSY